MDISEVIKQSGVSASTLRYYEEKGLIQSIGRRGLHRQYKSSVIDRLALIALGKAAGFSLGEIADLLGTDGIPEIDRDVLNNKADELDRMIKELTSMRDGLRHAAVCSAPSHMECPKFRSLMGWAVSDEAAKRAQKKATAKKRKTNKKTI